MTATIRVCGPILEIEALAGDIAIRAGQIDEHGTTASGDFSVCGSSPG